MFRTAVAALLFTFACSVTLYAEAADEAPPPREGGDKKPGEGDKGRFGGGKFSGKGKFGGKFDPEKAKEFQEKLKNLDPEKLKELKEKFGGKFGGGKGKIDPEKLKELKEKFKKQD